MFKMVRPEVKQVLLNMHAILINKLKLFFQLKKLVQYKTSFYKYIISKFQWKKGTFMEITTLSKTKVPSSKANLQEFFQSLFSFN